MEVQSKTGSKIMEDKAKICRALLPVLQMTRNLNDLMDLEYQKDEYDEKVVATFLSGCTKTAYVNMDSGTSMIRDIIRQII